MFKRFVLLSLIAFTALQSLPAVAQSDNLEEDPIIAVYRWYNKQDKDHIIVADGELSDGTLIQWKYSGKRLAFYAYLKPAEGRIAVYRWYNQKLNDWISVAEDEFTDGEMTVKGYGDKTLQFYSPARRCGDLCTPVYRWLDPDTDDWMMVADNEEGGTDSYCKEGWTRKTFSFYGLTRSYN